MTATSSHRTAVGRAPAFPDLFTDDALRIETPRLWLRWPSFQDVQRLHDVASREAVARPTATWPHPLPEGEALRRIERARSANARGNGIVLALTPKSQPKELIGIIGAGRDDDRPDRAEVGYLLDVAQQGRGLMTEALGALSDAVFLYTALCGLTGASGLKNAASRRVMEKAGFRPVGQRKYDAPARGGFIDCTELELTRGEWLKLRAGSGIAGVAAMWARAPCSGRQAVEAA